MTLCVLIGVVWAVSMFVTVGLQMNGANPGADPDRGHIDDLRLTGL